MKRDLFQAMGTTVDVTAPTDDAMVETRRLFDAVEGTCSRFLLESELNHINRCPASEVSLSPLMAQVMHAADTARTISHGFVDAGLGAAVRAWGYDRSFEGVRDRSDRAAPVVETRPEWSVQGAVLTRSRGTTIDLGGVAKGWTCDLAVERGDACIVSAGGDVRSAVPDAVVEIVDPWGDITASALLGVGALATSSVSRRRWRFGDREANHLIDPRTMEPSVGPVLQASAITATALEAEAAAKAILLQGADGLAWADRQPWIRGALAVWRDGNVYATTGLEMAA
ncbi:MAG: FAD:protein FMN transferase [Acidimicrobiia bacterium]